MHVELFKLILQLISVQYICNLFYKKNSDSNQHLVQESVSN